MSFSLSCSYLVLFLLSLNINLIFAQCPDGDEVTYGSDSWNGYVYDGVNSFDTPDFSGLITRSTTFDESFCGDDCDFLTIGGCTVNTETFSIRFRNQQTLACGHYTFEVGSDYGVRFSLNGGATYLINVPTSSSYQVNSLDVSVSGGTYDMIIEYFHNSGANHVSFDYSVVLNDYAGEISGDQTICSLIIDPSAFTSVAPAAFCSGKSPQYQWQESPDGISNWVDIPAATSETYDIPSGLTAGPHYYQRTATDGTVTVISNAITITGDSPEGDENFYPSGTWRGYVYEGSQNYSSPDYRGYFDILTPEFTSYNFCGSDACVFSLNGCDIVTENFSVRLRSEQTFACASYQVSVSGSDGIRLYIDGTELTNGYTASYSETIFLNGTHQFVIEYYDVSGPNELSFDMNFAGTESAGIISGDQSICANPIDPSPFTSVRGAGFCTGSPSYQWQESPDGVSNWVDVPTATSEVYDIPSGITPGTTYYRRRATNGISTLYSNTINVSGDLTFGDQNTFGVDDWIGYVYAGVDNFTTNYRGFYTQSNTPISPGEGFDQDFGGSSVSFSLGANGCDFITDGFSVRYKSVQDFAGECGAWRITIGGDDGVRLYVDGVLEIDGYSSHSYQEFSDTVYLSATHSFILEYYEATGANRISFVKTKIGDGVAGRIGDDQVVCDVVADPAPFTSVSDAQSCLSILLYQWEEYNGVAWDPIPGTNAATYDPPAGQSTGMHYYRRRAEDGTNTFYSNTVNVDIDPPQGDGSTPGVDSWRGYVYAGIDNYTIDYQGYIIQSLNFDESFCGGNCVFPVNGCDIATEGFSIRFLNTQTFACGTYQFTIGGDDGVRLYIDGVLEIDGSGLHPYTTYTETIYLPGGDYDLVLEYYDGSGGNRVSFNATFLGAGNGGVIGSDQLYCSASADPSAFTSVSDALFCSPAGPTFYQWQESVDGTGWSNISGAASSTYNSPVLSLTRYFRRRATDGITTINSNVVTVTLTGSPVGDPSVFGTDEWIGYVYNGPQNYNLNNYLGFITESPIFDEEFCSPPNPSCTVYIQDCSFTTDNFSVRFRMIYDFPSANYTFTIGGDDGVRLFVGGNPTPHINGYFYQSYTTYTGSPIFLDGPTELVLEYFEGSGQNRISFSYTSTPLPVTWYYFNGYYENGANILEWKTASELNNVGFDIERSFDGKAFEKIGWTGGHGTSNQNHEYNFSDKSPRLGWNYYRLTQIDYDGKFEYSRLIPIYVDEFEDIQIYPNPIKDHIYLSRVNKDSDVRVAITNIVAQRTYNLFQDPIQPARFALNEHLSPGMYSVKITMDGKVYLRKVIVE
ncbi:MAG TPA: PA14 domain-containing protein [Cyclobacteriaceae bacterium]|nr:PA14 domain-containing protein [Cyclobacteriaceae bacterium]